MKDTSSEPKNNKDYITIKGFSIKKSLIAGIIVAIFIIFYLWNNFLFLQMDTGPKATDDHFIRATDYYRKYFRGIGDDRLYFHNEYSQYPLLVFVTTVPVFLFMGPSSYAARLSIFLYTIIFLLSMFAIGKELGGYSGGFSVMVLASSSPDILQGSRTYFLDFPQTALTALAFYLLLKSDSFRDRKYSILMGIALMLSFMAKWSTAFFMTVPILWFLIPTVFKSKRSFLTFLGLLVPAGVLVSGTIYFFNIQDRIRWQQGWLLYYLLFVLVPVIVCAVIMVFLEMKGRKEEGFTGSPQYGVINFSYLSIIFALPVFLWIYRASANIRMEFIGNYNMPRWTGVNIRDMSIFLLKMFNYAIPLMIIGFILLFIFRKNLYRNLVIPLGFIAGVLVMIRFMYPHHRYLLSIIIFSAALAGYWVGRTGKARGIIAALLLLISLSTILSWTFIPGHSEIYDMKQSDPRLRFLQLIRTEPPDFADFQLTEVIDRLLHYKPEQIKNDILILYKTDPHFRSFNEEFRWQIIKRADLNKTYYSFFVNEIWDFNLPAMKADTGKPTPPGEVKNILLYQPGNTNSPVHTLSSKMVYQPDSIFIPYEEGKNVNDLVEGIKAFYEDVPMESKIFNIGGNFRAVVVSLYWKDKKDAYTGNP